MHNQSNPAPWRRGQSLVEIALALPLLLVIVVGIVDLGRVFNAYVVITNAAREGAAYGSLTPADVAGIKAHVINESASSGITIQPTGIAVSAGTAPGTPITVTVAYPFAAVTTITSGFWGGGNLNLTGRAVMAIR